MLSTSAAGGDPPLTLPNESATQAFARRLAALARPGDLIALEGDLGAGKTVLARAFINALPGPDGGPVEEEVPSPSFTLVQIYERLPAPVWHFDLYRLSSPEEVFELGIEEALAEAIALVEWPQRLGGAFAISSRLDLRLDFAEAADARHLSLRGGAAWQDRL
ncbi:MAG TPA: tRNA (adenosine(37)-N6)-threonylcarbamoyltransferase complex ATPase subunit type 1 TsaE, partial [Kiloniellaceae bacterium]|nr:tRNA (adenosine(37)-N6)-threonylcarbamoyltransferase complex ATPase subunit type 1 TsaE [Kiloniellaceae bacterium]